MISDRSTAALISSVVGGLPQNQNYKYTGMTIFFFFPSINNYLFEIVS